MIDKPGIYPNITAREYHADCVAVPSLSSTIAKMLVARSPRHAFEAHPRLGGKPVDDEDSGLLDPRQTKEKEKGTLIHRLVLGKGGEIVVCDFDSWRKDAAKAQRDLAKAKGQIPTLPHLFAEAEEAAAACRKQLDDMGFDYVFRDGMKEVVLVWEHAGTWFRAMADNIIIDENTKTAEIWDLKSCGRSSHPKACGTQIDGMGYDISLEWYRRGLITLRPDLAGRVKLRWAFLEILPPYAATPIEISAEWEMAAGHDCDKAIAIWRRCMETNKWGYYVDGITRIEPKPWRISDAFLNTEE